MQVSRITKYKSILVFVVSTSLTCVALALEPTTQQDIEDVFSSFMEKVRQGTYDSEQVYALAKKHGADIIPYVEKYLRDSDISVRWNAYSLLIFVGLDSNDVSVRQRIVYDLLKRLCDDAGNRDYLRRRLSRFGAAGFSDEAKELLREQLSRALVDERMIPRRQIILLIGVADMRSELPRLKAFIESREEKLKNEHRKSIQKWLHIIEASPEGLREERRRRLDYILKRQYWQGTLVWDALRARARMGVKEDIQRCIELVESHPNERYRVNRLLHQLAYIRQPEIVNYLHVYLNSDKSVPRKSLDVIPKTHAQRAAMALAEMLEGFPGREDIGGDQETIERCRKWMSEQTEWEIRR